MELKLMTFGLLAVVLISCERKEEKISYGQFGKLMHRLAEAWTNQNVDSALDCFSPDAIYMQPPAEQFYTGHEQLKPYFGAIKQGTFMKFHNLWFDKEKQTGAAEFTFANTESNTGVTGVTIISLKKGKIMYWREYFISGPIDFDKFISTEHKDWKWHIGNYP